MERFLLENALLIDPSQHLHEIGDVLIDDGKIIKIGGNLIPDGCKSINCKGLVIAPGLVDMHVHLRDPGFTYKEDIISGCESAAAGGVTSVLCMPNTNPAIDSEETVTYIKEKAESAKSKVYPVCSITKGLKGEELCDYEKLKNAGAVAVSDDGRPVKNAKMMKQAMINAENCGMLTISHCEDLDIIDGGIINEGEVSKTLGVKGMDRCSEDTITAREIILAENAGTRIHIAHVSTKGSVQLIREAKKRGVKVTCETAPHYMMMTDEMLLKKDADYRMNPPLRCEDDVKAIIEGVLDGTIDVIATDHAPHSVEEKSDFLKSPNGIVGLETSLSACITVLCKKYGMSIDALIEKMSINPAKITGIRAGSLRKGSPADIVVFNMDKQWTVNPDNFKSKARNSAFKNMTLTGKVVYTFLNGELVFEDKE